MLKNISIINQQIHIVLSGKIYIDEATLVREKLFPYIEQGYRDFIFDIRDVHYIDSSGLGVMIAIQKRIMPKGGGVKIKGLNGTVKELFELTRLTKVFEILPET